MLEFEAALPAVAPAADDDQRSKKSDDLEILPELLGVPDLTMLGFRGFPAGR